MPWYVIRRKLHRKTECVLWFLLRDHTHTHRHRRRKDLYLNPNGNYLWVMGLWAFWKKFFLPISIFWFFLQWTCASFLVSSIDPRMMLDHSRYSIKPKLMEWVERGNYFGLFAFRLFQHMGRFGEWEYCIHRQCRFIVSFSSQETVTALAWMSRNAAQFLEVWISRPVPLYPHPCLPPACLLCPPPWC